MAQSALPAVEGFVAFPRVAVVQELGDGHCMYRAFARQLWGDPERYSDVRRICGEQLLRPEARDRYAATLCSGDQSRSHGQLRSQSCDLRARARSVAGGADGDHLEMQALADALGIRVIIWRRDGNIGFVQLAQVAPAAGRSWKAIQLLYNIGEGAPLHYDSLVGQVEGDCSLDVDTPCGRGPQAIPQQFGEALEKVGLEPHHWKRVGPSEIVTDNAGGLHAAAHAFLDSDAQDIRDVADLLSAADPHSAKRSLRRLVAAKPLHGLAATRIGGSAWPGGQKRASALNATSVAAVCPWPYLGSLKRAHGDFNADYWQSQHVAACETCSRCPGDTRLTDGTVVTVSPSCAWYEMALRYFCGFDLPVGHLARRWHQWLLAQGSPASADALAWSAAAMVLPSRHPDNYASAKQWSAALDAKWSKELAAGWLRKATRAQVHTTVPMLGVVRFGEQQRAKEEARPVKVRFCSDLSHGEPSVNGVTPPWPFRYLTMRDVLSKLERGWFCAVADVDSCFRRFAWNEEVHRYMGVKWRGDSCVDQRLCFGWSGAPAAVSATTSAVCEAVAQAARRELHLQPNEFFVHAYIDDVISGAPSRTESEALFALVQREFAAHGLALKPGKSQPPSTSFTYLGWRCDTVTASLTLTAAKRKELLQRLASCLARGVTRRTLESFAGALSHFVTAIPGGRSRMQSLWSELASRMDNPQAVRAVGRLARSDLQWFQRALRSVAATQLWHDYSQSVVIICDASGLEGNEAGFGAVCIGPDEVSVWQRQWSAAERKMFAKSDAASSSTLREMLAAYLAAKHFRRKWACMARPVLFVTDSSASACCILRGASRANAAPGVRSLLNQLCRDMSDMFVAAGSDFAAWWCSRETASLQAVDWLSRTNKGQPHAQGETIWTPNEFEAAALKPGQNGSSIGSAARSVRAPAEAEAAGAAGGRCDRRSAPPPASPPEPRSFAQLVGRSEGPAAAPPLLRPGLRRNEVGQEREVSCQHVRSVDGSVRERPGFRVAMAGHAVQATGLRPGVCERAAETGSITPSRAVRSRVRQPADRGVPPSEPGGHDPRLGEGARQQVDQETGGRGGHVRPAVGSASDGGGALEAGGMVRHRGAHIGARSPAADGDDGPRGQSPRAAGVQCDVGTALCGHRVDAGRQRRAPVRDAGEGQANSRPGSSTFVRDEFPTECTGLVKELRQGVVRARSPSPHSASSGMVGLSASGAPRRMEALGIGSIDPPTASDGGIRRGTGSPVSAPIHAQRQARADYALEEARVSDACHPELHGASLCSGDAPLRTRVDGRAARVGGEAA